MRLLALLALAAATGCSASRSGSSVDETPISFKQAQAAAVSNTPAGDLSVHPPALPRRRPPLPQQRPPPPQRQPPPPQRLFDTSTGPTDEGSSSSSVTEMLDDESQKPLSRKERKLQRGRDALDEREKAMSDNIGWFQTLKTHPNSKSVIIDENFEGSPCISRMAQSICGIHSDTGMVCASAKGFGNGFRCRKKIGQANDACGRYPFPKTCEVGYACSIKDHRRMNVVVDALSLPSWKDVQYCIQKTDKKTLKMLRDADK